MTLLLKDPEAVLDYSIDWGAEYLGEDMLADSAWSVTPDEPDGVAVDRVPRGSPRRPAAQRSMPRRAPQSIKSSAQCVSMD